MKRALLLAITAGSIAAAGCTPVLRNHGYIYADVEVPEIVPGEDNQASVFEALGSPSTQGVFESTTWYYMSDTRQSLAYQRPQTSYRRVVEVRFDEDGVVSEVNEYGIEDGRRVALIDRETPTPGRGMSIWEQLFGNIGNLPSEQFGGEQNLPGGAGGPRRDE
ncbi:outer membrane protein assembly factor BamE [Hyphobacterium sp.]|uniref:outer membrane protein assembly factor BamE n=1 Tax=Hyphobacterium sp. TaxID=2004662 RepID=UPI003BACAA2C